MKKEDYINFCTRQFDDDMIAKVGKTVETGHILVKSRTKKYLKHTNRPIMRI